MPSGHDYAIRIREQAHNALSPQVGALAEELRGLQGTFSASIQKLEEKLQAILQTEIPITEVVLAEAVEEVTRQRDLERVSLAYFAHDIRLKETQQEILTLLLEEGNRFAPRVALFVVRDDRIVGWSSRAYSEEVAAKIAGVSIGQAESPFLQRALLSEGLTSCADLAGEAGLAQLFEDEALGPWHAFPLKAFQRPVAVLLAAAADNCRCDLESLCLILDLTGLYIENLALKILHDLNVPVPPKVEQRHEIVEAPKEEVLAAAAPAAEQAELFSEVAAAEVPAQPPQFQQEPPEPVVPVEPQPAAVPEPIVAAFPFAEAAPALSMEAVPEAFVSAGEPARDTGEASVPVTSQPDLVTEPVAAVTPEISPEVSVIPQPAADAGPAAAAPPTVPDATAPQLVVDSWMADLQTPEPPTAPYSAAQFTRPTGFPTLEAQPISEEDKLNADAKRFARLLVSEVKLYNEQRVLEGRENRDVYVRLKRDIDRSREAYQKRVSPIVARKIDYFHDEVVRILGDNDPSTLGNDYPGPLVES